MRILLIIVCGFAATTAAGSQAGQEGSSDKPSEAAASVSPAAVSGEHSGGSASSTSASAGEKPSAGLRRDPAIPSIQSGGAVSLSPIPHGSPSSASTDSLAFSDVVKGSNIPAVAVVASNRSSSWSNGTCVPYYLCKDSDIIADGDGAIDLSFNSGEGSKSSSRCPNYLELLCSAPLDDPDPDRIGELENREFAPSCGHRNPEGLGVKLDGFKDGESQFGEFPWMAIILEDEDMGGLIAQRFVCGGSLVHKQVIMTAAHCIKGKDASKLRVRLGDWDSQNTKEIFPHEEHSVAHIQRHERFHRRNLRYDVALLFLEEPVELKQHIGTLCLPEANGNFNYSSCVATGFGKDHFHGGRFQNIMKQVDLSIVSYRACQRKLRGTRLGRWFRLHPSFTCAGGEEGVDTCKGDGGGPLACRSEEDPDKYVQVGIVAWGIGCGEDGVPGVYTSVPKLTSWVNGKIADYFGSM